MDQALMKQTSLSQYLEQKEPWQRSHVKQMAIPLQHFNGVQMTELSAKESLVPGTQVL